MSFNTASGRCCCNKKKSCKGNEPLQGFNTASGRCCCNGAEDTEYIRAVTRKVSIPQAVGAVATDVFGVHMDDGMHVSIPQAVGAVATRTIFPRRILLPIRPSFNTASGRCCCNDQYCYHSPSV